MHWLRMTMTLVFFCPALFECKADKTKHVAGDYRSQFHVKAEKIAHALVEDDYDFGFLHIKAVDDTGHDQQPALKVSHYSTSCTMQI